jgi:hypothetical protein
MTGHASIPRIVNARTPEEWAVRIREKWQDSVAGIFAVGLELGNAREELGTAEFWKMVEDKNLLGFGRGSVGKLMKIAADTRLLEVSEKKLPANWTGLVANSGVGHTMGYTDPDFTLCWPPEVRSRPTAAGSARTPSRRQRN